MFSLLIIMDLCTSNFQNEHMCSVYRFPIINSIVTALTHKWHWKATIDYI